MQFPVNVEAVTVWEKTVVNRAPTYIRHELGACYWQDCRGQSVGVNGREPEDNVFLAIPLAAISDYIPKKDDRILPGSIPDVKPPGDALTAVQVKDFRYGSAKMQHIEVRLA